jgi:hypothetical protein
MIPKREMDEEKRGMREKSVRVKSGGRKCVITIR